MSHVYNSDWTWATTKGHKRRDKSRTFGTTEGNKAIFISYRKGKLTNPRGLLFIGFPATENLNVIMDQDFLTIIDILELWCVPFSLPPGTTFPTNTVSSNFLPPLF